MKSQYSNIENQSIPVYFRKRLIWICLLFVLSESIFAQSFTHTFVANSNGCNWPYSALAYRSNNDIYNFWKFDNTYKLIKWNGSSWVDVGSFLSTDVIANYSASDDVSIAIDGTGAFHVAFRLIQNAGCCSQRRGVWYGKSTDGVTWTFAEIEAYTDPNGWKNADDPIVRVDGSNNPHIAFLYDDVNGVRTHTIRYFKYNGSSWDAGQNAFSQTGVSNEVQELGFDLDGNGKAHIAFQREMDGSGLDGGLWYVNNTSGSWPAPTELQHGVSGMQKGNGNNLEVDNSNKVHIIHYDYQSHLTHSTDASGSWVHTWIDGNLIGTIGSHSFHLNGNGDKFFVYKKTGPNELKSAYQKSGESCWHFHTLFSGSGSFGGPPYAGTMSNARQLAVMTDSIIGSCSDVHPRKLYSITSDFASVTCGGGCTPPSFSPCPGNSSVNTSSGTCAANVSYTATATGSPAPAVTYSFTGATTGSGSGTGSGLSFNKGVTTVTITADNDCDPNAICTFTITVNDTQLPGIGCPSNIIMNNTTGMCGKAVTYTTPVGTDNCPSPSTTQTSGLASGSTFPVGVTTNTFKVTDASGNTATCSFTITVNDTELPGIGCPSNIVMSNTTGTCGKVITYTTPVGTDNCPSPTTTQTSGLASGSTFPVGVTTNTFKVTDASGNTATCSFTITVNDTELPSIGCPSNIVMSNTTGTCGKVMTYTTPVGADNCPSPTTTQTSGLASGSTFPVGATTNTFKVTDASGNTATCSFTITVNDTELPGIGCPSNIIMNNASGMCGKAVTYTTPVGTDNCPSSTTTQTSGLASGSTFPVGITTNTFKVTDASGNTATCSFIITVNDTELPGIGCPSNIIMNNTTGMCGKAVTYTTPVGTDNCPSPTTTQTSGLASGSTFPVGVTTNTFKVTDASGNTATCSFTVTIIDNQLPSITCPGSTTRGVNEGTCQYAINGTEFNATAMDNCSIVSPITYSYSGPTSGSGSNTLAGIILSKGLYTIQWNVTDVNGNSNSCSFSVDVKDLELPKITCPADKSAITLPGQCTANVALGSPSGVSDNCGSPVVTNNSPGTFQLGITMVTWTATDGSGNTKTCIQKVTLIPYQCGNPVQVFHTDTTSTTAKIKWKAAKCANSYQLRIRQEITPGVWGAWSSWVTSSGSLEHLFTGLNPGKFHHYQVRTLCGITFSGTISNWFWTMPSFAATQDRSEQAGHSNVGKEILRNEMSLEFVPNPARDYTTVLIEGFEQIEKTVTMLDLYGKLVFSVKVLGNQNQLELDLTTLGVHTGVYLLRVSDVNRQKTEQLMIER